MKKYLLTGAGLFAAVLATAQTVTTFAGKENISDPWANFNNTTTTTSDAYFYEPEGLCWDGNGKMYVTERNKIRLIDGTTVYNRSGALGDAQTSLGFADGTGVAAKYYHPISAVCDGSNNVFIVDSENHAIRKLAPFVNAGNGQIMTTFAGGKPDGTQSAQGTPGHQDASGTNARFDTPKGITIDGNGNMYVCDYNNFVIRKITPAGVVTTLAGKAGVDGSDDGTGGASARFGGPHGIAMLDNNNVVVTDFWNLTIRKVNITSGSTTTICGKTGVLGQKDGTLAEATFKSPKGIAVVNGLIYVADDSKIRVIDLTNSTVSTFAGGSAGNQDGVGTNAKFGRLGGLVYDGNNAMFATDLYFNVIRKITIDNLAPTAAFTATKTNLLVNEETTLSDISGGKAATSRKWVVKEQQTGSTANVSVVSGDLNSSENVTVKFLATGFYTVSLNVTNEFGSDQSEKAPYFSVSTSSVEQLNHLNELNIFPNPLNGTELNVRLTRGFTDATLELYEAGGRLVQTDEHVNGIQHRMSIPQLDAGTYFLVVRSKEVTGARMIAVQ
ncbi:MAG: T9SS type A sorting domain-containing protein [Flavobacteriales bacterium]|nr:T9SS type A sorting domain-containing protein [Bacteroidota bacterium]MCB9239816.1 T9SS type A sorting domain-containing protein [Flavobacteriales bacterium]